jgi:hypothetical protein
MQKHFSKIKISELGSAEHLSKTPGSLWMLFAVLQFRHPTEILSNYTVNVSAYASTTSPWVINRQPSFINRL